MSFVTSSAPRSDTLRGAPLCRRLGIGFLLSALTSLLLAATASAQSGVIAGTVVSAGSGAPVPAVTVMVPGTTIGTSTDANGRFRLGGLPGTSTAVEVRRIGYRPLRQTVAVGTMNLRFPITEQSVALDEVVITGTVGGQARREIGNAVSTVNASEVTERGTVNNVQQLLNGRSPGVFINPATGNVGTGARIRIRGASSLSLSNEPLIYIDGVRSNNQAASGPVNQGFGSSSISRINDINPDDIESIEIIKGPAAATLYGTEASNGVVQIITKKGAAGRARWNFSTRLGTNYFQDPENRFRINWFPVPRAGGPAGALDTVPINLIALEDARGTPVFTNGRIGEFDLSTSGGSELARYFAALGLEDSRGMEPVNGVKRRTGRLNVNVVPSQTIDMGFNVGYTNGNITLPCEAGCGGRTLGVVNAHPLNLVPLASGAPNPRRGWNSALPDQYDAFYEFYQIVDRFTGGVQANQQLRPWLKHRLNFGVDRTREENSELGRRTEDSLTRALLGTSGLGYRDMTFRTINNYTADYSAAGTIDLRPSLKSTTSLGAQYYRNFYERTCAAGSQFPAVGVTTVDATTTGRSTCHDIEEDATVGLFAQEQLGWNDKLFVTAAIRADDNSAFGRNFDRVYYPKFSMSYIPIEGTDQRIPYVNALKLRAAYGESGKQPITFSALQAYSSATGPGDVPAVTPSTIGNPELGPERSKEVELGFDLGAFNDRAGMELTYYRKRTVDAILDRQIAPSIGIPGTQPFNVGSIRNSGLELLLRGRPIDRPNAEWDVTFSYATNDNRIENLGTPESILELRRQTQCAGYVIGTSDPGTCPVADFVTVAAGLAPRHQVGYPIGSYFIPMIASATVNANGTVSNVLCQDGKGGTVACASAPALFAGRTTPKVEGSFSNTVTLLRSFRISALVDFKRDYVKVDGSQRFRCVINRRCHEWYFPQEYDPKYIASIKAGTDVLPEGYVSDASYTKLREVAVSYELPENLNHFGRFSRATIGLAGRNLKTWTSYPGLDPEAFFLGGTRGGNFSLFDQTTNPQATQWVVSLNLGW
jgi:TonB-dependent SusC/RagA subfamily outer membrane receptor